MANKKPPRASRIERSRGSGSREPAPANCAPRNVDDALRRIWHLAYFRALPSPRVDRHDRLVADTDAEMARIERAATQTLESSARVFDDVPVETVVRFGKPAREVALEAEVYAPQIVVVFAAARGLLARFRHWAVRRRLARRAESRVLVMAPPPHPAERRAPVGRPALRPPAPLPARRE